MSFSKDKYEVVRNAVSQELIKFIQISAEILKRHIWQIIRKV
jgi:hypothetical protein